jgi:hypothetical protein
MQELFSASISTKDSAMRIREIRKMVVGVTGMTVAVFLFIVLNPLYWVYLSAEAGHHFSVSLGMTLALMTSIALGIYLGRELRERAKRLQRKAMVKDHYYQSMHYNLKYKNGGLLNRVTARDICGIRPQDIEWIWIVEEKRNATPEEIRELCKRAPKKR